MIVGFALEDRPKRMRMGVTRWYDQALALHLLVVSAQVKVRIASCSGWVDALTC